MNADTNGRTATIAFWGALVVALVLVAVVVTGDVNRAPLDPRSIAPDGARALVEVLERAGADVEIGQELPSEGADVALLLADTYGVAGRQELTRWVERGGRLLVADQTSPLTPAGAIGSGTGTAAGTCGEAALAEVARLNGVEGSYPTQGPNEIRCFGGAVVVTPLGEGVIVSLAGPGPLVNEYLDEADNAVLAVAVLAPVPGTSVAFLEPRLAVAAGENLEDLIGDPVWMLLVQLGVAFVVIALWKARRVGRPVPEPVPVEIAGSELAAARGRLLAGLRDPAAAATELRADARRTLARAVGLGSDAGLDDVSSQVAARTGRPIDQVRALLDHQPIDRDGDLVAIATALADLTEDVTAIGSPSTDPRSAP